MNKDKKHIDELFSKSLNQRTFDIPESFLEDLNTRLDALEKKKKRRGFFWWFVFVAVGTGALLAILLLQRNDPGQPGSRQFSGVSKEEKIKSPDSTQQSRQPGRHPVADTGNITFTGEEKKKEANDTQSALTNDRNTARTKREAHSPGQTSKRTGLQKGNPENNAGRSENAVPPQLTGHSANQQDDTETGTTAHTETTGETKEISDPVAEDSTADAGAGKDTIQNEDPAETAAVTSATVPEDEKASKKQGNNWEKEIQLYGGFGMNVIHDAPVNEAYLSKISAHQSPVGSPSFGVNGHVSYKKFTFGTGIGYSQAGETFSSEVKNYILKDSTVSQYILDTVMVYDSISDVWIPVLFDTTIYYTYQHQDSVWKNTSFKNRYSWISIPIHFGYRFGFGHYELIPRIGAQFNFGIAKNTGAFPNEDFNGIVEYQSVRFNVSYLVQLEARRNFNRWHVFITPYFKSMINPSLSGDLIRRKYSLWGVQAGVGFKL